MSLNDAILEKINLFNEKINLNQESIETLDEPFFQESLSEFIVSLYEIINEENLSSSDKKEIFSLTLNVLSDKLTCEAGVPPEDNQNIKSAISGLSDLIKFNDGTNKC